MRTEHPCFCFFRAAMRILHIGKEAMMMNYKADTQKKDREQGCILPLFEGEHVLPFVKMQGCGNDYIYIDCFVHTVENPEALAIRLSDRHFSVGGDGVVLICPSAVADAQMRMFNLDGSEGRMCGNAIRCVGKYLHDVRGMSGTQLSIETKSGIKQLELHCSEDGSVAEVQVDMGQAHLHPSSIPVALQGETVVDHPISLGGHDFRITCVSMGNPHCVTFLDDVDGLDIAAIGPLFEHCKIFPERVNTEFVQVLNRHTLRMRVWERGSGETLACGTGACACVVAAVKNGICPPDEDIRVQLTGGTLTIRYTPSGTVLMTGPAAFAFEGTVIL